MFVLIDADIHFDNIHWVDDTLKLLSSYDIIQMFNVCLDLDSNGETMACYHSFGYQYHHRKKLFWVNWSIGQVVK